MLVAQKSLQLQDKVVFEKMTLQPQFKRLPKTFYGDEACFLFVIEGTFKFRTPTDDIRFKEGDGMLAQCGNYLMETLPAHPDHGENLIVTKLKELLILLSKSSQSRSVQRLLDSLFTPYAHDFKNVVRNNLYSDLTVAELVALPLLGHR